MKNFFRKEMEKVVTDTDKALLDIIHKANEDGKLTEFLKDLEEKRDYSSFFPEPDAFVTRKQSKTMIQQNAIVDKIEELAQDKIKLSDACYLIAGMAQKMDPRYATILKSFYDKDAEDAVDVLYSSVKKLIEDYLELKENL